MSESCGRCVAMDVDEARRDAETPDVEVDGCAAIREIPDLRDVSTDDADIGTVSGCTGPVEDLAAPQDDVEAVGFAPVVLGEY